ncbi:MAG: methyltransferase family protein [Candidatus Hodarchaeota archaeon]
MEQINFMVAMFIRLLVAFILVSVLLFVPAGTFDWPEAWTFIIILLTYGIALHLLVFKDNRTALKSRQSYKPVLWIDMLILLMAGIFIISMFILIGLDVGRFHWTSPLVPVLFRYLGFFTLICSLVIYMLVIRENTYLSRIIEIQEKQVVISTGPYSFVRHPMYLGNVFFVLSIPFALGSYVALIPAFLFLTCFIPRILFEEKILVQELDGYKEYMQKVRYRVIPRIW